MEKGGNRANETRCRPTEANAEDVLAVFEVSLEEEYCPVDPGNDWKRYLPELDNGALAALDWFSWRELETAHLPDRTGLVRSPGSGSAPACGQKGNAQEQQVGNAQEFAPLGPQHHLAARTVLGVMVEGWHIRKGRSAMSLRADAARSWNCIEPSGIDAHYSTALCFQGRVQAHIAHRNGGGGSPPCGKAEQIFESTWPPALRIPLLIARLPGCFFGQGPLRRGHRPWSKNCFKVGGSPWTRLKRLTLQALGLFWNRAQLHWVRLGRVCGRLGPRHGKNAFNVTAPFVAGLREHGVQQSQRFPHGIGGKIDEALVMGAAVAYPAVRNRQVRVMELLDPLCAARIQTADVFGDAARMLGRARHALCDVQCPAATRRTENCTTRLLLELQGCYAPPDEARPPDGKEGEALSDEGRRAALALPGTSHADARTDAQKH